MAATLWSTMAERFRTIGTMLSEATPTTAALVRRLAARARRDYGDAYCGGRIQASPHAVLDA